MKNKAEETKPLLHGDNLRNKLARIWVEETTNSGQVYRHYFSKKQVDKIVEILLKYNK